MTSATPKVLVRYTDNTGTGIPPGTVYNQIQIPKSGGGMHPHPINILVPDGSHAAAVIVLHGGSGNDVNILRNLGLVHSPSTVFTASDVNWPLLQAFGNLVVAAPQGWADPATYSTTNPQGVASWDNYFMNGGALAAGWDDMQMLQDLKSYLQSQFGLAGVSLAGHSNGGMMVQRVMLENDIFSHYMVTSGPMPDRWIAQNPVFPAKPYFSQWGAQDDVINIIASGFASHLWDQTTKTLSVADVNYPALSHWWGEWDSIPRRFLTYGGTDYSWNDGVVTTVAIGTQTEWSYFSGKIKIQLLSDGGHSIKTHQQATGRRVFGDWMKFVVAT